MERRAVHPDGLLHIAPEMMRDLRITTTAVESRPGGEGVGLLGELAVNEGAYAEVGSPINARVLELSAAPGDTVAAGQPLLRLQSIELGRARAELLQARARAELAARTLERKQELAQQQIVAAREVQEAEAEATAARADVRAASAALRALGVTDAASDEEASEFTLRSPIAGVVIDRTAVLGRLADPTQPLLKVADLSRLWLVAQAFERDAVRLRPGSPALVTLPALPGVNLTGRVALVGRMVDRASRTIPVRIELANRAGVLRPGMSATAWVSLGDSRGAILTVPAASLQRLRDHWCVFLPHGEGTFEVRPVGRGRDLGGEVEALSGLKAGETVVVDGAFLLKAESEKSSGEGEHHEH